MELAVVVLLLLAVAQQDKMRRGDDEGDKGTHMSVIGGGQMGKESKRWA
jgi:hypothetical protein